MKFIARFSLVLLALLIVMPVFAADPEAKLPEENPVSTVPNTGIPENKDASDPQNPAINMDDLSSMSPMMAEIRVAMDLSRGEIAEMSVQAAAANDFAAKQAIQVEISALKQQTELDILAIQSRYARAEGNEELALKIADAIEAINSPPAPAAPAEARPAPNNQN